MKRISTQVFARRSVLAIPFLQQQQQVRHNSSSYPTFVNGLFKRTLSAKEMFPYPRTRIGKDERERLTSLLNLVNEEKDTDGGKSSARLFGGIRGMSVGTEFEGGLHLSHTSRAAVLETLGEGQCVEAVYSSLHTCTCAYILSTFGTAGQKGAYLPLIANGSATFAFAFGELGHDADVSMGTATAACDPSTGAYTVTGAKVLKGLTKSQAEGITHFLVIAKAATQTLDERGAPIPATRSTLFVVPKDANTTTIAADGSVTVAFASAPALDVIGTVGEGYSGMMVGRHMMRYGHDAALIGTAKGLYGELLTAGAPAEVLGLISALVYGMESGLYTLTANMDNKSEDLLIDAAFASINTHYCAKKILALARGVENTATGSTLEAIVGSSSLSSSSSSSSSASDASSFTAQLEHLIIVGAEAVENLEAIAACCGVEDFGLQFQKEGTFTTMGGRMARGLGAKQRLPLKVAWPEAAPIEDQFTSFGDAVEAAFVKCGPSLRYKQLTMHRIATSGAYFFAACAALSRAVQQEKNKETGASERALCKVLLPYLAGEAGVLAKEVNNTSLAPDDSLVRVVGEMTFSYVPIDPNSPELKAQEEAERVAKEAADKAKKEAEEKAKKEEEASGKK